MTLRVGSGGIPRASTTFMRSRICKSFTFHAAHVIPHHRGKCANLHGHTYRTDISVTGDVQTEGKEAGMVVDFDTLKQIWRCNLEPLLDHRNLNETLVDPGKIPHSTAEHLSRWILEEIAPHLPRGMFVTVRVWETPTSYAEAS
jgi:6-pyruvoyltetrahydropterin/6-carboxytetrahydropterin synthase